MCVFVSSCVCMCVCVQTSIYVSKPYTKDGLSPERFPRRDRPCWTRASARIYACARARKDRTHDPNIYVPDMHDPTTRTVYTLEEGTTTQQYIFHMQRYTCKVQSSHLCFSSGFLLCRRLFLAFCLCFSLGLRESKGIRDNVSACVCL